MTSDSPPNGHWLIASDLDGTLLDHYSYSHSEVDHLLGRLERREIPVVLNSSKTLGEMLEIRRWLHNRHPFVVENGSAIFIPTGYFPDMPPDAHEKGNFWVIETGAARKTILEYLRRDAEQNGAPYLSFSAATTEEIVTATGLSTERAQGACQRGYSEPLLWRGGETEKHSFCERAAKAGFTTLEGGRFLHLLGRTDKGAATRVLLQEYRRQRHGDCRLIAAGDSSNDLDMLRVADIAVIIRSPSHPPPALEQHPRVIVSELPGPAGWNQVMEKLFFGIDEKA